MSIGLGFWENCVFMHLALHTGTLSCWSRKGTSTNRWCEVNKLFKMSLYAVTDFPCSKLQQSSFSVRFNEEKTTHKSFVILTLTNISYQMYKSNYKWENIWFKAQTRELRFQECRPKQGACFSLTAPMIHSESQAKQLIKQQFTMSVACFTARLCFCLLPIQD